MIPFEGGGVHQYGAHPLHIGQIHPLDLLSLRRGAVGEDHHVVVQGIGIVAGGADAVGGGGARQNHTPHGKPPQDTKKS